MTDQSEDRKLRNVLVKSSSLRLLLLT